MTSGSDRAWLEGALDRHEGPLLRYAASLVGKAAARDVVQDTFLALCRAERTQLSDHLAPWLFVVCKNLAFACLRDGRRLTPLGDEDTLADDEPWRRVEAQPAVKQIEALIDQLPDKQRQTVILRFSGGLTYKEIAEVMDLTVNHVGVLLHTALGRLRERLTEPSPALSARSAP